MKFKLILIDYQGDPQAYLANPRGSIVAGWRADYLKPALEALAPLVKADVIEIVRVYGEHHPYDDFPPDEDCPPFNFLDPKKP